LDKQKSEVIIAQRDLIYNGLIYLVHAKSEFTLTLDSATAQSELEVWMVGPCVGPK